MTVATSLVLANGFVIRHGADQEVMQPRDVLIHDGKIQAIVSSGSLRFEGCAVIDVAEKIVMPGFVDTHRHIWQTALRGMGADLTGPEYRSAIRAAYGPAMRPQDVYIATLAGALEALDGGITTILDWAHIMNTPEHADASIAALRESGMRTVFAYGAPNDAEADLWWSNSARPHPPDVRRARASLLASDDALTTMAFAARAPHLVREEVMVADWTLARDLNLRITVDGGLGGGLWGTRRYPIRLLRDAGLLGSDTTYIHCNNLADDEYTAIADSGGCVSISPCAEMHVGHGLPATGFLLRAGIRPALSVDYVTQVAGDMFGAMRSTLATERGLRSRAAFLAGHGVAPWELRTSDVFEFATARGAAALGLSDRIGTLDPGKQADVIVLDATSLRLSPVNNPVATAVLFATPGDVETVIVAGEVRKRDGRLVSANPQWVRALLLESRDRLNQQAAQFKLNSAEQRANWSW